MTADTVPATNEIEKVTDLPPGGDAPAQGARRLPSKYLWALAYFTAGLAFVVSALSYGSSDSMVLPLGLVLVFVPTQLATRSPASLGRFGWMLGLGIALLVISGAVDIGGLTSSEPLLLAAAVLVILVAFAIVWRSLGTRIARDDHARRRDPNSRIATLCAAACAALGVLALVLSAMAA